MGEQEPQAVELAPGITFLRTGVNGDLPFERINYGYNPTKGCWEAEIMTAHPTEEILCSAHDEAEQALSSLNLRGSWSLRNP
jgi:hypothetical protein